jgi:hypothetical protein
LLVNEGGADDEIEIKYAVGELTRMLAGRRKVTLRVVAITVVTEYACTVTVFPMAGVAGESATVTWLGLITAPTGNPEPVTLTSVNPASADDGVAVGRRLIWPSPVPWNSITSTEIARKPGNHRRLRDRKLTPVDSIRVPQC